MDNIKYTSSTNSIWKNKKNLGSTTTSLFKKEEYASIFNKPDKREIFGHDSVRLNYNNLGKASR